VTTCRITRRFFKQERRCLYFVQPPGGADHDSHVICWENREWNEPLGEKLAAVTLSALREKARLRTLFLSLSVLMAGSGISDLYGSEHERRRRP
jgi:hypothetical protein